MVISCIVTDWYTMWLVKDKFDVCLPKTATLSKIVLDIAITFKTKQDACVL